MLPDFAIGFLWVAGAWVFFGSFSVPVKLPSVRKLQVTALVFQSYKTMCMFLTSWLVLAMTEFSYTPFGFASGLFWVSGSLLTVMGFQYAGIAVGSGVCSSVIVVVSFGWAALFNENVWSVGLTVLAVAGVIGGILGMIFALRPRPVIEPVPLSDGNLNNSESSGLLVASGGLPSVVAPTHVRVCDCVGDWFLRIGSACLAPCPEGA